jgi:hypothetical protein
MMTTGTEKLNWMSKMKIGLGDNALSTTSNMKAMAFSIQNHIHCELATGNEINEQIHNVKPLTPELMPGGTCRR